MNQGGDMRTIPASLIGIAFVALSLFGTVANALTGPVPANSLPGGAIVVDSDNPGSGEAWGRTGGRTFSYSGFALSNFSELTWQALSAGMSFNGPVDEPGETMALTSQSTTTATWEGVTTVDLEVGGSQVVNTRFTATLVGAFFNAGSPTVDVLTYPAFTVQVLFEAEDPNNPGVYEPALELYDVLPTSSTTEELANTTFDQGFFFEESSASLSLAEHDANMQNRADEIAALLDFLTIDTVNRLIAIAEANGQHNENTTNRLNTIAETTEENKQKLMELLAEGNNETLLFAIQNLVGENSQKLMTVLSILQELGNEVNNLPDNNQFESLANDQQTAISILACMWIGALCEQIQGLPPGLPNIVSLDTRLEEVISGIDWMKQDLQAVREDLEAIVEDLEAVDTAAAIELEVISSNRASGKSRVMLVLSKVNGVATTSSLSVQAATDSGNAGFSLVPVVSTAVELAPGVQELTVELQGNLKSTRTFLISAERLLEDDSMQHGATLTSTGDNAD